MSASKNKQEAFDFMVWATSPEQIKISATRGNPPVRFSVFTDPELTSQEKFRHFPILMEAINFSTPRPRHPKWPEIENALGVELSKAVAGTMSPDEALANARSSVEAIWPARPPPEAKTGAERRTPLQIRYVTLSG